MSDFDDEEYVSFDLDGAGKVREKDCGAFQHAHHDQFFVVQVAGDLRAHLRNAVGDLLTRVEDFQSPVSDGGHKNSIAREGGLLLSKL